MPAGQDDHGGYRDGSGGNSASSFELEDPESYELEDLRPKAAKFTRPPRRWPLWKIVLAVVGASFGALVAFWWITTGGPVVTWGPPDTAEGAVSEFNDFTDDGPVGDLTDIIPSVAEPVAEPVGESVPAPIAPSIVSSIADSAGFTRRLDESVHNNRSETVLHFEWIITNGSSQRPDGVLKDVYFINGAFPGPTLEARSGDELIITVKNQLGNGESVAIHWHGLRISNVMDGAVGVTQCGVEDGHEMKYRLRIPDDQYGTFWYRSTFEHQRADGLYGPLIVHKPIYEDDSRTELEEYKYGEDQVLMIGDWYHHSTEKALAQWRAGNSTISTTEPVPDSILLNGKGFFDCSTAATIGEDIDCQTVQAPALKFTEHRARLRIINTGSLAGFWLIVTGFKFTLVQVDGGHRVDPQEASSITVLYPGERIDVLLEREFGTPAEAPGVLTIHLDDPAHKQTPNLKLASTQHFKVLSPAGEPEGFKPFYIDQSETINLRDLKADDEVRGLTKTAADHTVLLSTSIKPSTGFSSRPHAFINETSWMPIQSASVPLLMLKRNFWSQEAREIYPQISRGAWVDIVLNNLDDRGKDTASSNYSDGMTFTKLLESGHPFHLHGHDFYVISTHRHSNVGTDEHYNPFDPTKPALSPIELLRPVSKDTIQVPPRGYVVLRFLADKPGMWQFHSQVIWHEAVGMTMSLEVPEKDPARIASRRKEIRKVCQGLDRW